MDFGSDHLAKTLLKAAGSTPSATRSIRQLASTSGLEAAKFIAAGMASRFSAVVEPFPIQMKTFPYNK
jgi:hypothetical protein